MSDEQQTATESAPVQPEPTVDEAGMDTGGGKSPFLDMDARVRVDGSEMTVGQLVQSHRDLGAAEEYNGHARRILQGDGTPEDNENSLRYLMSVEGYAPDQIDAYIEQQRNASVENGQPPQPAQPDVQTPLSTAATPPPGGPGLDYEKRIEALEKEHQLDRDRQVRDRMEQIRERVQRSVASQIERNPAVRVLLEASRRLQSEDDAKRVPVMIGGEIERELIALLKQRQASGQEFSTTWFDEEAPKAAKAVAERYRTVIGDPDRIQRAPETAAGERAFLPEKKVPEPEFKGQHPSKLHTQVHEWTTDALSRLSVEAGRGGETRV